MTAFWMLAAVCAALLAALALAVRRLYELQRVGGSARRDGDPRGRVAEETFQIASDLQEYAIAQVDDGNRTDFCGGFLEDLRRMSKASQGWFWTWEEDRGEMRLAASTEPSQTQAPERGGPAEQAFASKHPSTRSHRDDKVLFALPVMAKSKPFGVVQLELDAEPDMPLQKAAELLAGEAASVLGQFQKFENLQMFHIEMVETLYKTVNALDPNASQHAAQTRRRAHRAAVAMGLPETMARHVEYAALLRGVGKIGIDQAILNKPGKLTAEEYEKIKRYTTIGHQLLAQVKHLAPAAKMVLYHQEWWDGRGYPEGLKGEMIPLGARIIAVISAWEAMTSHRPYRKALTSAEAIVELRRAAGTQFDPAVVEAFAKLQDQDPVS
ncbi:MAG: HD domain-containing protein [Elusimicrobia bacterium]|nr:HD domain-containing protein [Elusimicrobiota bacterium]